MTRRPSGNPHARRSVPETAAGVLRRHLAEQLAVVVASEPQAAKGSVEALHDIRVALRRMRSLTVTFEKLDRDFLKDLDRRISKVCDRMGEARDMDVWIDLFRGLIKAGGLDNMPPRDRRAVLTVLRRQRMHLATDALACGLFRRVKKELRTRLRKSVAWRKKSPAPEVFAAKRMLAVRALIEERYRRVGNYSQGPAHDLRRAGRRLRYLTEFFAPRLGPACVRAGQWITKAQAALGKVHDCDSALELSQGLPSGAARVAVRRALKKRRAAQLRKFKTAWRHYADRRLQKAWRTRLEAAAAG
jgi:CHAD domain-containing protein